MKKDDTGSKGRDDIPRHIFFLYDRIVNFVYCYKPHRTVLMRKGKSNRRIHLLFVMLVFYFFIFDIVSLWVGLN